MTKLWKLKSVIRLFLKNDINYKLVLLTIIWWVVFKALEKVSKTLQSETAMQALTLLSGLKAYLKEFRNVGYEEREKIGKKCQQIEFLSTFKKKITMKEAKRIQI